MAFSPANQQALNCEQTVRAFLRLEQPAKDNGHFYSMLSLASIPVITDCQMARPRVRIYVKYAGNTSQSLSSCTAQKAIGVLKYRKSELPGIQIWTVCLVCPRA